VVVDHELDRLLAVLLVELGDRRRLDVVAVDVALRPVDDRDLELVEAQVDLVDLVG